MYHFTIQNRGTLTPVFPDEPLGPLTPAISELPDVPAPFNPFAPDGPLEPLTPVFPELPDVPFP
jgi:hypothetical protein